MNKAVFLDRDGTINVDKDYLHKISDFEYIDGVLEALLSITEMGFLIVIVTNQSGIARGYYGEDDFRKLNDWMIQDLKAKGINIAGVYYCPHLPDGSVSKYAIECSCRKPATGLFWRAKKELNIDMDKSVAIGDKIRDLSICLETKAHGILLKEDKDKIYENNISVCKNWNEALNVIKSLPQSGII